MPSFAAFRSNFPNPSGRLPANLRVSSGVGGFATLDGCCAFVRAILEEKYLHVGHGGLIPGRKLLGHCCEKARDAKDLASMMSRLSSHKHKLAPIAKSIPLKYAPPKQISSSKAMPGDLVDSVQCHCSCCAPSSAVLRGRKMFLTRPPVKLSQQPQRRTSLGDHCAHHRRL